jgi:hypothetical protein
MMGIMYKATVEYYTRKEGAIGLPDLSTVEVETVNQDSMEALEAARQIFYSQGLEAVWAVSVKWE